MISARKITNTATKKACGCLDDFLDFVNQGNVIDLAVGLMLGAAFTAIVKSLVADIFTPVISLASGNKTMSEMFLVLRYPPVKDPPGNVSFDFNTVDEAKKAGAITLNYGRFFMTIIDFFIIAVILFIAVKIVCIIYRRNQEPCTDWPCPKCREMVKEGATRCPHCTTEPISPVSLPNKIGMNGETTML